MAWKSQLAPHSPLKRHKAVVHQLRFMLACVCLFVWQAPALVFVFPSGRNMKCQTLYRLEERPANFSVELGDGGGAVSIKNKNK